jgi:PadR family transcriptional regulator PadR
MKETGLGEFEEVILLIAGILGEDAYALRIADEFTSQTTRNVSIGAVHSTLTRLEEKGFLKSGMGKATAERGGRRKRIYTITAFGKRALEASREFRMSLWNQYPAFANDNLKLTPAPLPAFKSR